MATRVVSAPSWHGRVQAQANRLAAVSRDTQSLRLPPQPDVARRESQTLSLKTNAQKACSRRQFLCALGFLSGGQVLQANVRAKDAAVVAAAPGVDLGTILQKSTKKALGGGKAGASAALVQVVLLKWLRTAMNYQYRYGGDLGSVLQKLYTEGGIPRLYQGLPLAMIQGPLSRFGDTAANVGIFAFLDSFPETAELPIPVKTAAASFTAGLWRVLCMPVDTSKVASQVEGQEGLERLKQQVLEQGPAPFFRGTIANAVAHATGNYFWFVTYNLLNGYLPYVSQEQVLSSLLRSAFLGLSASCASDTISNSLRVIKITQQTALLNSATQKKDLKNGMSAKEALALVLETDGVKGLFGRGLKTRLITNCIQGALFSVLWRYFQQSGVASGVPIG
eukprot:gnl/MRDRNA2_/MRDRNA2_35983_c0_seq1.p1 gnl/MRDRNA2_/MRDRNA2_35983_c0~~gnl/MRDRNA2_/MRDRNA2_35983_c0_seq1.p1  ORF type:complete len:437 (+),score=70.81 gnl/MRDRNA2_/MRDRNA2_35983_c0_seq1:135-1313(+)